MGRGEGREGRVGEGGGGRAGKGEGGRLIGARIVYRVWGWSSLSTLHKPPEAPLGDPLPALGNIGVGSTWRGMLPTT